jgi:hypothetical protein
LSICTFSFGHCVVCSSSIYGFWLSSSGRSQQLKSRYWFHARGMHTGYSTNKVSTRAGKWH